MESDCSKIRIVFIIDEASKDLLGSDVDSASRVRRSIQSIVLRVLAHFSHPSTLDTKRLQWGFRFYDSARSLPKYQIEKRAFCDFDLKSFEALENTIDCRFDPELSEPEPPTSPSQNDAESNWWQFRSNLRQCLQDILIDYKWDSDSFGSPVAPKRSLRGKSTSQIINDGIHNMVFLFAKCPHTMQDSDWFTGNKHHPQLVLKSILPDLGYREFCDVKQIQLHWVDLSDLRMNSGHSSQGFDVINKSLRLLKGSVIPATNLLKLKHQLTTFNQDGSEESSFINGFMSSSCASLLNAILLTNDISAECNEGTSGIPLVMVIEGKETTLCSVEMSSMQRNRSTPSDQSESPSIRIRASIPRSTLELTMLDSIDIKILSTENNSVFSALIGHLASSRSVLLVDYVTASSPLPTTSVLQPLTFDSATMTTLKSCATVAMEKSLAFGAEPNKSEIEDVQLFVEKCCNALSEAPKINQLTLTESVQRRFEPEMMAPWYKPEAQSQKISDLLNINSSSETFDETELQFLQKLQDKMSSLPEGGSYNSLESLTLREKRLALSPKTPKKTPRKRRNSFGHKTRRTPVAVKKLRRSPRKNHLKDGTSTSAKSLLRAVRRGRGLNRTQSVPSRIDLILKRSKEARFRETDDENSRSEMPEAATVRRSPRKKKVSICEHANLEELSDKIRDDYLRAISGDLDVMQWSGNIVSSAANYYKVNEGESSYVVSCWKLFEDNILSTCAAISRKYSQDISSADVKLNEYQCQVILRLNLHSLSADEDPNDSLINELASLLRAMTFIKHPTYLSSYLNETLLPRFVDTCGRLLFLLFEELLQPVPPVLRHHASSSPSSSPPTDASVQPPSFLFNEDSNSQFNENSVDLSSTFHARSKLKRFSSFQLTGSRQIAIAVKAKKTQNDVKKTKNAPKKPISATKVRSSQRDSTGSVKRNLFEQNSQPTLSRHHSAAVMQHLKSPKRSGSKTPQKMKAPDMMSPIARKTPRRHHVLKTKTVSETPVRKQRSNMVWHNHERKRQRANTVATVVSIQESPDKACATKEPTTKTPRQKKARLLRGASFYANVRSRSVSSYEEARSQGAAQKLLSPSWNSRGKLDLSKSTPGRRIQSQALFKGFLDPSPDKVFGADFESPAKICELDSPSVNTRLQALKNRMVTQGSARKNLFNSFSAEDTPSKNTRSQILSPEMMLSPLKGITPKKRVSLSFNTPVKLLSPAKLDFKSGLSDSLTAITPKKDFKSPDALATPSKNTRSQQRLLLSPTSTFTSMNDLEDEVIKQRFTKRKELPDAAEALSLFGSDFKKRKTSEDYFETTEIFVEKSPFLIEDSDANSSFPNKENKRNFTGKFGSLESDAQTNSASDHIEFNRQDSDVADSPIFATIADSPPASPVFPSPVASKSVGFSPQIDRITPGKTKKYSPLMSKQSLMHLMNSPMMQKKEDESHDGKSRRELYKSQNNLK